MKLLLLALLYSMSAFSAKQRPSKYLELLDYVQPAPDQGETRTCLYMASTGAVELLANKKHGIRKPRPNGVYDLAESYVINADPSEEATNKTLFEVPVLRFNKGFGIHITSWPFEAWTDSALANDSVWHVKDTEKMTKVSVPKVETIPLFSHENKHATYVLNQDNIQQIKDALWEHKSPVLANYVDDGFWHVVLIVGYDDELPGECYEISSEECSETKGSFYVRDSFGIPVEVRDYDWFKTKGSSAFIVKEAK